MRCSKQTTNKLGQPKVGKMLAVEAISMHCYCFFLTSIFANTVVLNCTIALQHFLLKLAN